MMDKITSQITASKGFARQNRYEISIPTITLGQRSSRIYSEQLDVLQYPEESNDWMNDYFDADLGAMNLELMAYCEQTQLPSYQFQLETNSHYGPSFKIPHRAEYQDLTMTFLCGNDMLERYFFDAWMYMIMDPGTNNFNYIDEYAVDIDIVQYKERAEMSELNTTTVVNQLVGLTSGDSIKDWAMIPNYVTTLVDAFPIAINTQELGYGINDSIQKLQVTFTYKFAIPFYGKGAINGRSRRGTEERFRQTITPPAAPASK